MAAELNLLFIFVIVSFIYTHLNREFSLHTKQTLSLETVIPRENISDAKLGRILTSCNHEAKAMLLMRMRPGSLYTPALLHKTLEEAQTEERRWKMNDWNAFSYCLKSLSRARLVDPVFSKKGSVYGFQLNQDGEQFGKPLAALLLDFSLRNPDFALDDFFGAANSNPLTRIRVFKELLKNAPRKVQDLVLSIGIIRPSSLFPILKSLHSNNIVLYLTSKNGLPATASLTENQRALLHELMEIIEGFQGGDPRLLEKAKQLAGSFSKEDISELMLKARNHSPDVDVLSGKEIGNFILSLLKSNGEMRIQEIKSRVKLHFAKMARLSSENLNKHIRGLVKTGEISIEKRKDKSVFTAYAQISKNL